jgi:L-aspartate oxidase
MWDQVGLVRSASSLEAALGLLGELAARGGSGEADNLALVGWLIAAAARNRRESRGGHYRVDFPIERPGWRRRQFATLASLGFGEIGAGGGRRASA